MAARSEPGGRSARAVIRSRSGYIAGRSPPPEILGQAEANRQPSGGPGLSRWHELWLTLKMGFGSYT
jgi:hypothetical protein